MQYYFNLLLIEADRYKIKERMFIFLFSIYLCAICILFASLSCCCLPFFGVVENNIHIHEYEMVNEWSVGNKIFLIMTDMPKPNTLHFKITNILSVLFDIFILFVKYLYITYPLSTMHTIVYVFFCLYAKIVMLTFVLWLLLSLFFFLCIRFVYFCLLLVVLFWFEETTEKKK